MKNKKIAELEKLYKRGVELRNVGHGIGHPFTKGTPRSGLEDWIESYRVWREGVFDLLVTFNPGAAARFHTLNRIPERGVYRFWFAVSKKHRLDLRTLERRLEILELIFDHYSGITIEHIDETKR